jgi:hypothetical protein
MRVTETRRLPFTDANAVLLVEIVSDLLSITDHKFSITIDYSDYRSKCHFFVLI